MLFKNSFSNQFYISLLLLLNLSCKERTPYQDVTANKNRILNCYITKPVKDDSKADSLRNFEFSNESLDDFLSGVISAKKPLIYDSTMDYVTSFEKQRLIFINNKCFERLNQPDSSNMMDLYFNSGYRTKVMTKTIVEFIQSYKKSIYNFGNAIVYEYQFNGVAEVESYFMYIILKEKTEDEQRYGSDYKGLVICSDGLTWKDFTDKGFSIPSYVQMIRRDKAFEIPLYYDGNRFIPLGHFKIGSWQ